MARDVRSLFLFLIGTTAVIVVACIVIENLNLNLNNTYLNTYLRTSIRKSCEFFNSETYKEDRALTNNLEKLGDISGNFYGSNNASDIYNVLFPRSSLNRWSANIHGNIHGADWSKINKNMDYLLDDSSYIGKFYKEALMTPANLGIPYIGYVDGLSKDRAIQVTERIAKWYLTSLLINGNENLIGADGGVMFNGFKVYTNELEITKTDYQLYDLYDDTQLDSFKSITNMEGSSIKSNTDDKSSGRYAMTVALEFKVPVAYEGITPLKTMVQWASRGFTLQNENLNRLTAKGWLNNQSEKATSIEDAGLFHSSNLAYKGEIVGGGATGHTKFSSSKLVYYIIH